MTRTEFNALYREARITVQLMSDRDITREQKKQAEDRWISWQKQPRMALAMKAVCDAMHFSGTISNAALHDLRFCGGTRRDWYLRMARDKRAGKLI